MHRSKFYYPLLFIISISLFLLGFKSYKEQTFDEIERINLEIELQGLEWKAGVTSLTYLTPEEKRLRLGGFAPLYEDPAKFVKIEEKAELPNFLDWRSKNGRNYMTIIKSQGSCGSCWAFSAVGMAEAMYNIEKGIYSIEALYTTKDNNFPKSQDFQAQEGGLTEKFQILALSLPNLSEQDLVSCSSAGTCNGGYSYKAFDYMKTKGIVTEDCFPYVAKDAACTLCSDWNKKLCRINGWGYVTQSTVDKTKIKTSLQDGPLSFRMEVYDDFYYYSGGIYEKTASANYEGDHLCVLIGYNEDKDYWICKNSWGKNWGEDGYFKIRMGECGGGKWITKAWGVSVNNRPPVLNPIANQTVKEGRELTFKVTASDPDNDTLTFSASPMPSRANLNSSTGLFKWTPKYTQAGNYKVTFTVTDEIFERSRIAKITVINVKKAKGKF